MNLKSMILSKVITDSGKYYVLSNLWVLTLNGCVCVCLCVLYMCIEAMKWYHEREEVL